MTERPRADYFVELTPLEGARMVKDSKEKIESAGLPTDITSTIFANIHDAIDRRRLDNLDVDYTSSEEVTGLVSAAMGGFDHLMPARRALYRYVVGIIQTNDEALRSVDAGDNL